MSNQMNDQAIIRELKSKKCSIHHKASDISIEDGILKIENNCCEEFAEQLSQIYENNIADKFILPPL
jgi:hypothetical protein